MGAKPARNDPCWCGSGRKYKRCCLDRDRAQTQPDRRPGEEGTSAASLADEMTLVIRTPTGIAVRRIPTARPLPGSREPGYEAEDASSDAATIWGLPDFTCTVGTVTKGNARREVADRLIVIGGDGAVIQVKARVALTGDAKKEARWLHKQIAQAIRQGRGTVRTLCARQPVPATNARGNAIEIVADDYAWLIVVIIDHRRPPDGVIPALAPDGDDVVVMLRRDWEFLFDQLKSTHAVMTYLKRVSGASIELGTEPARYYDLAQDDADATPSPVDLDQLGDGAQPHSEPLLPMEPVGNDPLDLNALHLIRAIMEDLAIAPITGAPELMRLRALAALDEVPVAQRVQIGRLLIRWMEVVADAPDEVRMRRLAGSPEKAQLAFGVAGSLKQDLFSLWLQLRHYERQERTGRRDEQVSIGVQLTPRHDPKRPWDTTMIAVSGAIDFTAEEVAELRTLFGNAPSPIPGAATTSSNIDGSPAPS
jgi:SEC-C motif